MRILITQRVDIYPDRAERRDALDQAWSDTLGRMLGQRTLLYPLPNKPYETAAVLDEWNPSLIVLSGGNDPGDVPERDATEEILLNSAAVRRIPVFAVCRGMQMVQRHLGGELEPVFDHVRSEHRLASASHGGPVELQVNSFHNWGISRKRLAHDLEELYCHADGTVEAARHLHLPWLCVMWHPERPGAGMDAANDWAGDWLGEVL